MRSALFERVVTLQDRSVGGHALTAYLFFSFQQLGNKLFFSKIIFQDNYLGNSKIYLGKLIFEKNLGISKINLGKKIRAPSARVYNSTFETTNLEIPSFNCIFYIVLFFYQSTFSYAF